MEWISVFFFYMTGFNVLFLQIFLLFSFLASSFYTFSLLWFCWGCFLFFYVLHSLSLSNSYTASAWPSPYLNFWKAKWILKHGKNCLLLILNSNCNQHLHFFFPDKKWKPFLWLFWNYLRAKYMIHMSYIMHNPLCPLSVDGEVLTMIFWSIICFLELQSQMCHD